MNNVKLIQKEHDAYLCRDCGECTHLGMLQVVLAKQRWYKECFKDIRVWLRTWEVDGKPALLKVSRAGAV